MADAATGIVARGPSVWRRPYLGYHSSAGDLQGRGSPDGEEGAGFG